MACFAIILLILRRIPWRICALPHIEVDGVVAKERKTAPNKGKPGRPTLYSEEVVEKICEGLAGGATLEEVCAAEDMPATRTVHTWRKDKDDFAEGYTFAMQGHCHFTFDQVWGIAKDRSRDTRVVDAKNCGRQGARTTR
jgi:Bacteriophage Sf6, terminase small subunit-like